MVGYLIPVPFILVMLYALVVPNGKNRHVGYLGAIAGIVTLLLAWTATSATIPWFSLAGWTISVSAMMDTVSIVLASLVAGIGIFVFLYSVGYFKKGEDLKRYYVLLALFAWSMLGVVIAGNLFQLFFCWELVGVSSYLLIGFWHKREEARRAAAKAILTILTGDVFFLIGILVLAWHYNTIDITQLLSMLKPDGLTTLAGVGIILGGISKSAQFPLHGWLPDAMAGPTPVSAFLHSATMVKAGLFVIVRFLPLLVLTGLTPLLTAIALITIVMSGMMALVEKDIKRVLAYSTMNQLAFMLLAFSLGAVVAGLFHMVTHAIFKALLFFVAGIVIHTTSTQDLTKTHIKWSWTLVPVSALVGVLALAGVVPFAGFFSKEAIFETVLHASWPIILVFTVAIMLSAAYIFRWFFLIFGKTGRTAKGSWELFASLPVLAFLALCGGFLRYVFWDEPHALGVTALLSTALLALGVLAAYEIFVRKHRMSWLIQSPFAEVSRQRFLMNNVYNFFARVVMVIGRIILWIDESVIDRSIRLLGRFFTSVSAFLRHAQSGNVQTYLAVFILGFLILAVIMGVYV